MTTRKRESEELQDRELENVSGGATAAGELGLTVNPLADPRPSPIKEKDFTDAKTTGV